MSGESYSHETTAAIIARAARAANTFFIKKWILRLTPVNKNKYIIPKVIIFFQITSGDKKTEKSPHTLTASLSRLRQREDELQPSGDA